MISGSGILTRLISFISPNDQRDGKDNTNVTDRSSLHLDGSGADMNTESMSSTVISPSVWAMWSNAKKKVYLNRDSNPSSFLYRFNQPGEPNHFGPWTDDEKAIFMNRLIQIKQDSTGCPIDWGKFSIAVPGRVGYQCSAFYRKLLADGELIQT
jgi:hypothetical protein